VEWKEKSGENQGKSQILFLMKLKFQKTLVEGSDQLNRITVLCWSPNNHKLAVAFHDRIVHIYDETGDRKDKFPTKASDAKVRSLSFIC
jgi:intraflagellar transport protein 172